MRNILHIIAVKVKLKTKKRCIEFLSLQDLKGSIYFGGNYDKLKHVKDMHWDLLVIDEAHEGIDTSKTDIAFNQITRNHTLHLSGTPFKAWLTINFCRTQFSTTHMLMNKIKSVNGTVLNKTLMLICRS